MCTVFDSKSTQKRIFVMEVQLNTIRAMEGWKKDFIITTTSMIGCYKHPPVLKYLPCGHCSRNIIKDNILFSVPTILQATIQSIRPTYKIYPNSFFFSLDLALQNPIFFSLLWFFLPAGRRNYPRVLFYQKFFFFFFELVPTQIISVKRIV